MTWLPKSRTARRRLMIASIVAPVLALAVGLSLYAARGAVSLFLIPSQALKETNLEGKTVQLGGYVRKGSVVHDRNGDSVQFIVADGAQPTSPSIKVSYSEKQYGVLPDLFREGQGVVTKGVFESPTDFRATQVLAKHDEKYMPREVTDQLKKSGEWRPEGQVATGKTQAYQ
jgi:cytochrome c-type biogenesis protein CcmE